jgi:hypothetical protein
LNPLADTFLRAARNLPTPLPVMPAKACIQQGLDALDSRLRGNDKLVESGSIKRAAASAPRQA